MADTFRDALLWHMDAKKTAIADLARGSGVSVDIINKLKAREGSSTTAENARAIAAYYGQTLDQFMKCEAESEESAFIALVGMLSHEERRILLAQMRGILSARERK